MLDTSDGGGEGYIDNVLVTSIHGPSAINHGGLGFLYKGIQILSVNNSEYTGDLQVFYFNSYECDKALGRNDWNGEIFAVFIADYQIVAEIIIYRHNNNNGVQGDGWGQFVKGEDFGGDVYFRSGGWLYFSLNFAKSEEDFEGVDGSCQFQGPFSMQGLEVCVNQCEDFERLEEAMGRCIEI